jgi:hypothetical protein
LKGLEQEAIARLVDVAGNVQLNVLEQVNPAQFLGIEINPRAAAIAELVIWIGYLQWYFKRYGNAAPPEPVLQAFGNIECRDAVLAYDGREPDLDAKTGEVRSRWGGKMMKHPVTGEDVPDPLDRVVIYKYLNARAAEWPAADYIVSNPPFIGKINMRESLGDGYTETLRRINKSIPDSVDLVMYWWNQAAELTHQGKIKRFGFISTNSISQTYNRRVLESYLETKKKPLKLFFAVPDHPWIDAQDGASIRIAITAAATTVQSGTLAEVIAEAKNSNEEASLSFGLNYGYVTPSLTVNIDLASVKTLKSNSGMACVGYQPTGQGFVLDRESANKLSDKLDSRDSLILPLLSGRDITQNNRNLYAIDLFGLEIEKVQKDYPLIFQWLIDRVKPEREQNNNPTLRKQWWTFEKNRNTFRPAIEVIDRFIVTSLTSKHRFFTFEMSRTIADSSTVIFAFDNGFYFGILSSTIHVAWATKAGSRLGIGNDPRYIKTVCFDPFPFPDPTPEQKQKIRELGDRLDSHRKQVQAAHPDITITGMYNLLEKLRAGEPFTDVDRAYNNKALVSTLKQIHDDLDIAVFAAYGWQDLAGKHHPEITETILERLVALNAERAAEERNGHIRSAPNTKPPNRYKLPKLISQALATQQKSLLHQSNSKNGRRNPKTNSQPSAICYAAVAAHGQWCR